MVDWELKRLADEALVLASERIKREEGLRLKPYHDTDETLAIGYGRNLMRRGISEGEAAVLLANDLDVAARAVRDACSKRALRAMGSARMAALMSMAHQLGAAGLRGFRRMWQAIEGGDWEAAAAEALDSRWAQQTPERARRVAEMLRTGVMP